MTSLDTIYVNNIVFKKESFVIEEDDGRIYRRNRRNVISAEVKRNTENY